MKSNKASRPAISQAAINATMDLNASRKLLKEIEASIMRLMVVENKNYGDAGTAAALRMQLQDVANSIANCAR